MCYWMSYTFLKFTSFTSTKFREKIMIYVLCMPGAQYTIKYQVVEYGDCGPVTDGEILSRSPLGQPKSYELTSLEPWTTYRITVESSNDIGTTMNSIEVCVCTVGTGILRVDDNCLAELWTEGVGSLGDPGAWTTPLTPDGKCNK